MSSTDNPFNGTVDPAATVPQLAEVATALQQGVPLDQSVNPDENPAPSQAALDQPDLGGGILQQQAAAVADKFDPTLPFLAEDPEAETFPGVDTSPLNLGGAVTQETILRLDVLRLAHDSTASPQSVTERAAAYWNWISEND